MVWIIEHTEAQYKEKEMEFGKVLKWCPERLVLECGCGERPTISRIVTACDGCGKDYMLVFQVKSASQPSEESDRGNGSSPLS